MNMTTSTILLLSLPWCTLRQVTLSSLSQNHTGKRDGDTHDDDEKTSDQDCSYWLVRPLNDDNAPLRVVEQSSSKATEIPGEISSIATTTPCQVFCLTLHRRLPPQDEDKSDADPTDDDISRHVGTTLLWRNDRVQIWEFRLAPGQACVYHRHTHPYLFLNLTASHNQPLDRHGQAMALALPSIQAAGQCTYVPRNQCSAHAIRNVGHAVFLQFIVEFL